MSPSLQNTLRHVPTYKHVATGSLRTVQKWGQFSIQTREDQVPSIASNARSPRAAGQINIRLQREDKAAAAQIQVEIQPT